MSLRLVCIRSAIDLNAGQLRYFIHNFVKEMCIFPNFSKIAKKVIKLFYIYRRLCYNWINLKNTNVPYD